MNWHHALRLQTLVLVPLFAVLVVGCGSSAGDASSEEQTTREGEWIQLFNGKNLDGWTPKVRGYAPGENPGNTFRVEDGLLTVGYEAYDDYNEQFGHLVSDRSFSHYIVAAEYRFVGEQAPGGPDWAIQNSGIMVHSQSAETMMTDQDFPISIEVQLLGAAGQEERPTANMCSPGTHVVMADTLVTQHCVSSSSQTYPDSQWVRVEVLVRGDSLIQHRVNGELVSEYSKPQIGGGVVNNFDPAVKQDGRPLTEGHIALQSESHPIQFRKVEVRNLGAEENAGR